MLAELVDRNGEVVVSEEVGTDGSRFSMKIPINDAQTVRGLRAYYWSQAAGKDAVGWIEIEREADGTKAVSATPVSRTRGSKKTATRRTEGS